MWRLFISTVKLTSKGSSGTRVEVLSDGVWGPVCTFGWDKQDANVVCRQLGYSEALAATAFRLANDEICLDDMQCNGNESSILQCRHGGWVSTFGDSEISSAICSPSGIAFYSLGRPFCLLYMFSLSCSTENS